MAHVPVVYPYDHWKTMTFLAAFHYSQVATPCR